MLCSGSWDDGGKERIRKGLINRGWRPQEPASVGMMPVAIHCRLWCWALMDRRSRGVVADLDWTGWACGYIIVRARMLCSGSWPVAAWWTDSSKLGVKVPCDATASIECMSWVILEAIGATHLVNMTSALAKVTLDLRRPPWLDTARFPERYHYAGTGCRSRRLEASERPQVMATAP